MAKRLLALFLALMMAFCVCSATAFADEIETPPETDPDIEETPYNVYTDIKTTIYVGKGYDVYITVTNHTMGYIDIWMYDYSGTEVWYQYHSISPNGVGYYYVGSNVKYVKIRGSGSLAIGTVTVQVE